MDQQNNNVSVEQNPEQPTCQCGDDYNKFCSLCSEWRKQKVMNRAAKYRKPELKMVVEVPPVKTNKLDKKRFHTAKLLLQKTLGRKLTNQQFNDYLKIRAESLRKKREEIATYGPEGKPEEKPLSEAPAEVKIDQAIKDALK